MWDTQVTDIYLGGCFLFYFLFWSNIDHNLHLITGFSFALYLKVWTRHGHTCTHRSPVAGGGTGPGHSCHLVSASVRSPVSCACGHQTWAPVVPQQYQRLGGVGPESNGPKPPRGAVYGWSRSTEVAMLTVLWTHYFPATSMHRERLAVNRVTSSWQRLRAASSVQNPSPWVKCSEGCMVTFSHRVTLVTVDTGDAGRPWGSLSTMTSTTQVQAKYKWDCDDLAWKKM